jgi:hypothetical protein
MGRRGAGFGSFEGEADAVNARLRAGFAGRTQTPAQVEANALAAAIAEANRLVAIEMARLTPGAARSTGEGGFKSIADSVKGMVGELKNATPAVLAWAQEMDRQAMAVEQRFAEMANNITESLTNLFSDVLMGQADAFERFLQTIERMLADFAARQAVNAIGRWIGEALLSSYSPLGGAPAPAASLTGARSAALAGGDSFHVNVSFAPNFIDGRSGAAWLRENEGVITEAVINGVRKSGAARQALVGR